MGEAMNVEQIIIEYLKSNGFEGFCDPESECGCGLNDLFPCNQIDEDCQPAYRCDRTKACEGCSKQPDEIFYCLKPTGANSLKGGDLMSFEINDLVSISTMTEKGIVKGISGGSVLVELESRKMDTVPISSINGVVQRFNDALWKLYGY